MKSSNSMVLYRIMIGCFRGKEAEVNKKKPQGSGKIETLEGDKDI